MTTKSDDVVGRVKVYESIVKGLPLPKPGIPESFKVLIKEFQALGLDITVLNEYGNFEELKDLEEAENEDNKVEAKEESVATNLVNNEETDEVFEEYHDDLEEEYEDEIEEIDDMDIDDDALENFEEGDED